MFRLFLSLFAAVNGISGQENPFHQPVSKEGGMCGGMMPLDLQHICANKLECVNTHGPMLADAPGTCRPKCPTKRDDWGNCIPKNCEVWNDGCNTCSFKNNQLGACTELVCVDARHTAKCERYSTNQNDFFKCSKYLDEIVRLDAVCCADEGTCVKGVPTKCSPECASIVNLLFTNCEGLVKQTGLDKRLGWEEFHNKCKITNGTPNKKIPKNCALWFDGCNTCSVNDGKIRFCTKRMCLRMEEAACREHHTSTNTQTHEKGKQCFDGKDNDHDGKSDCDDVDCKIYGRCRHLGGHETGRLCFDGIDNDHDGKADCNDPDCLKDPRSARHCRCK